ncbi:MAG: MCP methyltransferase, CheR-type [uncultured Gemmatimonadaceae bacterium]|uniref:MCP methyltransferase, CheR-type n=1 Tax=uncultured Gemmatimonadaceae bacterium TaxID=246130 RepID=A0A6J4KKQ8_9BACT|nr:MAG: MCP methyltransferase, CheR-type [uncultured Gemmatimonadaceae bacterium]
MMTLPAAPLTYDPHLERIEIELLLEGVYRHYGFDFRSYAYASLRRRIWKRVEHERLDTVTALTERVLHEPAMMERLLLDLSINVTAMFRDPGFHAAFRREVVPLLRTYPFFRIWHAGCSTGEEVYSMAIVLEEEGLYDRARIYATDINELVLQRAKAGIFPLERMQEYTENYIRAGGTRSFSEYYTAKYDGALFKPSLSRHIVFSQHNLVTDRSFAEFNVILCRNVLIYFDKALQERVHGLFFESLATFGVLAVGSKESLRFSKYEDCYEVLSGPDKIYRKVRTGEFGAPCGEGAAP